MDYRQIPLKIQLFFTKTIREKLQSVWLRLKKFYFRTKGQDPDLLTKISKLYQQRERYKTIIRRHHEELSSLRQQARKSAQLEISVAELTARKTELETQIADLMKQIAEMESDFCEFKEQWLNYLKATDWKKRGAALQQFLDYLQAAIPLIDEDKKSIVTAHQQYYQDKVAKTKTLFSKLIKPLLPNGKSHNASS